MDIVNLPRSSVISAGGMIFQNWSKAAAQKIEILKQFHPKDLAGRFVDFPAGNFDIFNLQTDQSDSGMDRASLSPNPDHPLLLTNIFCYLKKII